MFRAFSMLSVGCVVLLVQVDPARSPAGDDSRISVAEENDLAAESLARLQDPTLTPAQRDRYLRQLGRVPPTPRVLHKLICWLEYNSFEAAQTSLYRPREAPDPKEVFPAYWALTEIGPAATSALIDEYLHIFENTDPASRRGRVTRGDGRNPEYRVTFLCCALTAKGHIAQSAVAEAKRRMAKEPNNAHVQKACGQLAPGIVAFYPERDRERLFPGVSTK